MVIGQTERWYSPAFIIYFRQLFQGKSSHIPSEILSCHGTECHWIQKINWCTGSWLTHNRSRLNLNQHRSVFTVLDLMSGQEHWQLGSEPCQMEVVEHPGERTTLAASGVPFTTLTPTTPSHSSKRSSRRTLRNANQTHHLMHALSQQQPRHRLAGMRIGSQL